MARGIALREFVALVGPAALLVAACGSSSEPAAEDHAPVRFDITVNGTLMTTDTIRLRAGVVDTVRFTFFNAGDEDLGHHEGEHYSGLGFPGGVNALAATDSTAHYTQLVTNTEAAGSKGMATVSYGHDSMADEYTFPAPFKFE